MVVFIKKLFSWLAWNGLVGFIYVDSIFNITSFHGMTEKLVWPVTLVVLGISMFYGISMYSLFKVVCEKDRIDVDNPNQQRIYLSQLFCKKCNLFIDSIFFILLTANGLYMVSLAYLIAITFHIIGDYYKDLYNIEFEMALVDKMEKEMDGAGFDIIEKTE